MKSIMHEASSLAKAIEQGWEKAGKPTDFSIKILEKPQKNFFGFTTHPAKIAIYFDERPQPRPESHGTRHKVREVQSRSDYRSEGRGAQEQRPAAPRHAEVRELRSSSEQRTRPQRPEQRPEQRSEPRHEQRSEQRAEQPQIARSAVAAEAQWNEDMIAYVREWLDMVLPESVGKRVGFTVEPNNLYLRITFESSVLDNQEKEKRLYASLSLLILEALKRKFRAGLRRHKIILTNG